MANKIRNTAGKFAPKSEAPRKVRSVNLTDDAWQWLATVAEAAGVSRNDYLEALADGSHPLIETVEVIPSPLMETVDTKPEFEFEIASPDEIEAALVTAEEAKKHAAIYGFSPDEALADAYFQLNMLTSNYDGLEDRYERLQREHFALLESSPLMETAQAEIEALKQELRSKSRQLEEQDTELLKLHERNGDLGLEVQNLKEELGKERAERQEIEAQLSELKQNSAPAAIASSDKTLPDAAKLLSQLRGKRKKSKVELADVEVLLGLLGD